MNERVRSRDIVGKILVSEESGKKFGVIGDIDFIVESGELINLVVVQQTRHVKDLNLQEDEKGRTLIPFSAVKSVGDFVIVSEREMV